MTSTLEPLCTCDWLDIRQYFGANAESWSQAIGQRQVLHDRCVAALQAFTPASLVEAIRAYQELDDPGLDSFKDFVEQHEFENGEDLAQLVTTFQSLFEEGVRFGEQHPDTVDVVPIKARPQPFTTV